MINKGFIDGAFDFFHYGHVLALFQSKQKSNILCAATHSDEEIYKAKQMLPIFTYHDRHMLLKNCKFIDVLYDKVPYNTTIEIINSFECEQFFHGTDDIDKYPLSDIKKHNRLTVYNRTSGVSTSNILKRIKEFKENKNVNKNNDYIYLRYLFDKINTEIEIKFELKIVILKCPWDIINKHHIKLINDIKDKYDKYLIYIDMISDDILYDIFSKHEMAITLLGIKNIDRVLIYNNINISDFTSIISINSNLFDTNTDNLVIKDFSFNSQIEYLSDYKLDLISNINIQSINSKINKLKGNKYTDIELKSYYDVLDKQFDIILSFIKTIKFNEHDIIIFDIDETCLNNLMYNDIHIDEFNNDIYNYKNGVVPIIKECIELFKYIHSNSIKYSFISGRRNYIRQVTINNLLLTKLNKYIHLYTCDNNYIDDIDKYKESCRIEITEQGYNIILCIGDQISDITRKYIGIPFLIFNPFYTCNK